MKEDSSRKIFNPFKDLLADNVITKAKSGITDLMNGVKNLFKNDETEKETAINNYLKSPDEIDAELRFISVQKDNNSFKNEDTQQPQKFLESVQKSEAQPANFHSLEEALAGEMEENY